MQTLLKILAFPFASLAGAARWFSAASPAAQVTTIVVLFECLICLLAAAVVWLQGEQAVLQSWWSLGKGLSLLALLLFIPWLARRAAKLWFERQGGRWPDIAAAWTAAMEELERQQVSLAETPVFIVLGTNGGDVERGLFKDTAMPLAVEHAPSGGGPLHVYANRDAVFLCLSGCGQTGLAASPQGAAISGAPVAGESPSRSSVEERRVANDRLEYVCDMLRTARRPLAPVNGLIVVTSLPVTVAADREAVAFGQAVGDDLATLTRSLGVRAAVTFVAATLQDDPAVAELLTRLSPADRAAAAGVAFPPGLRPTPAQLADVAANVSGPLIDRLTGMLLDPRRINDQPTNRHLLGMMCRLGLIANHQMARVLTQAFATDVHGANGRASMPLLAGVAVAAVSLDPGRRAFVRGLIDRVVSLQGELEWTPESIAADERAKRVARLLAMATGVLVAATVTIAWWKVSR